jgi:predicted secreted hydrolase
MRRRALLHTAWQAGALAALGAPAAVQALQPRKLVFPQDHGSHPELRTEWWYVTGYLNEATGATAGIAPLGAAAHSAQPRFGFQVTFFRSRVDGTQDVASAFAAKQLVLAHAAITDLRGRRLLHDQRLARAGFGIAEASEADTDVRLRGWQLKRSTNRTATAGNAVSAANPASAAAHYSAAIAARDFSLQGQQGLSRKGPQAQQASYYYSQPQLAVSGEVGLGTQRLQVRGRAWLDHEWSEALLHPLAVGWDWIGMNLHDGAALTAFRLRTAQGEALWAGGSYRSAGGALLVFGEQEVRFVPRRTWRSTRTPATYPVDWTVSTPAGTFEVRALLDDQELDSSGSTGAVYWEGLSALSDPSGQARGLGYLEMTGYTQPIRF